MRSGGRWPGGLALPALTMALVLAGCTSTGGGTIGAPPSPTPTGASSPSGTSGPTTPPAAGQSATELAALLSRGIAVDYEPLASPETAVETSDLVISGPVREVIWVDAPEGSDAAQFNHAQSYAVLVVEAERVVSGSLPDSVPTLVPVAVLRGRATDGIPAPAVGGIDVVAVLHGPRPLAQAGGRVRGPEGFARQTGVYGTPADGLFLQGPADVEMLGVHSTRGELRSSWGSPVTLADYEATLVAAAR